MDYLLLHYWPFIAASMVAGILVGGWLEATRRPRKAARRDRSRREGPR